MNEQKHIIWSSDVDYEDWRADLEEQYPDLSEQERMELMVEQNNDYLDDERCNLNIQLSRPILLIADIGRWDGRYPGYAVDPPDLVAQALGHTGHVAAGGGAAV